MHDVVFYGAMIWMTVLLGVCVLTVVKARSELGRVLALDTLALVLIAALTLYSITEDVSYYLDAAMAIALISFIGTVAAARYHSEGKIF